MLSERNLTAPLDMVDASSSSVLAPTLFSMAHSMISSLLESVALSLLACVPAAVFSLSSCTLMCRGSQRPAARRPGPAASEELLQVPKWRTTGVALGRQMEAKWRTTGVALGRRASTASSWRPGTWASRTGTKRPLASVDILARLSCPPASGCPRMGPCPRQQLEAAACPFWLIRSWIISCNSISLLHQTSQQYFWLIIHDRFSRNERAADHHEAVHVHLLHVHVAALLENTRTRCSCRRRHRLRCH